MIIHIVDQLLAFPSDGDSCGGFQRQRPFTYLGLLHSFLPLCPLDGSRRASNLIDWFLSWLLLHSGASRAITFYSRLALPPLLLPEEK